MTPELSDNELAIGKAASVAQAIGTIAYHGYQSGQQEAAIWNDGRKDIEQRIDEALSVSAVLTDAHDSLVKYTNGAFRLALEMLAVAAAREGDLFLDTEVTKEFINGDGTGLREAASIQDGCDADELLMRVEQRVATRQASPPAWRPVDEEHPTQNVYTRYRRLVDMLLQRARRVLHLRRFLAIHDVTAAGTQRLTEALDRLTQGSMTEDSTIHEAAADVEQQIRAGNGVDDDQVRAGDRIEIAAGTVVHPVRGEQGYIQQSTWLLVRLQEDDHAPRYWAPVATLDRDESSALMAFNTNTFLAYCSAYVDDQPSTGWDLQEPPPNVANDEDTFLQLAPLLLDFYRRSLSALSLPSDIAQHHAWLHALMHETSDDDGQRRLQTGRSLQALLARTAWAQLDEHTRMTLKQAAAP